MKQKEGGENGLRISYLLQQFPIASETFAVSDIAALIDLGHEVTVYTLKPPRRDEDARLRSSLVPAGLRIMRPSIAGASTWPALIWRKRKSAAWLAGKILPHWRNAASATLQALLSIPRLLEIEDQIAKDRSDVVHAFWSRHAALVLPLLKHDGSPALRTAFIGAYDLVEDDFIVDLAAGAAEILFSHAEVNRPFLGRKAGTGTGIAIAHRGIPLMPANHALERDPFRLVTASALVPSKNVEAVIASFARAHAADDRLTLRIFGDGPHRQRLEQMTEELDCADAVTFGGNVPRDVLFREMQKAALFLLLTKKASERLPNVLKEALWAGCGVIASRSEGIEELLPDSGLGLIVDPDDQQSIAAGITKLLSESNEEAEQRRTRARKFIADRFSSTASMQVYAEQWRGALRTRDTQATKMAEISEPLGADARRDPNPV